MDFVVDRIWQTDQKVITERLAQARIIRCVRSSLAYRRLYLGAHQKRGDVIVPVAQASALAAGIAGHRFETIARALDTSAS